MDQEIMVVSVQSGLFAVPPLFLSKANKILDSLFGWLVFLFGEMSPEKRIREHVEVIHCTHDQQQSSYISIWRNIF